MCLGMNPDQPNELEDVLLPQIEILKEDKVTKEEHI